ncbi:MAG: hypothetical protein QXQ40_00270 [Candidatus Aenigmatarchaeota archaeon]
MANKEEKLRKELKREDPTLTEEEINYLIDKSKEKDIWDAKELLAEVMAERISKNAIKGSELSKTWSAFQKDLLRIRRSNIPEEEKTKLRKAAYADYLRRTGLPGSMPGPSVQDETKPTEPQKEIASMKEVVYSKMLSGSKEEQKVAEEADEILEEARRENDPKKANELIERAREILRRSSSKTAKEVARGAKFLWRERMWPIHKLEPEETRLLRAVVWAKRRLDGIARGKNKEIVDYKIKKIKEIEDKLKIKDWVEAKNAIVREVRRLEKRRDDLRNRIETGERGLGELLRSVDKELEIKERERLEIEREFERRRAQLEAFSREWKDDLIVLKEILHGEVPNVVEETYKKFHIYSASGREEIRTSLESFADAEASHMIEHDYRTIYQSARGWFVKEIYRPVGGPFASLYELIGNIWDFIINFIFSPIVTGVILLWILFSIFARYAVTGPTIVVLIITVIITVFMTLGQFWASIFEMFE